MRFRICWTRPVSPRQRKWGKSVGGASLIESYRRLLFTACRKRSVEAIHLAFTSSNTWDLAGTLAVRAMLNPFAYAGAGPPSSGRKVTLASVSAFAMRPKVSARSAPNVNVRCVRVGDEAAPRRGG